MRNPCRGGHPLLRMLRIALGLVGLALLPALSAAAQEPATAGRSRWLIGGSIGMPALDHELDPELFTVGIHWTQVRAGRMGADFALGTMPRVFAEGIVAAGACAGVALPLELSPGLLLLPSSGVSLLGGYGAGAAASEIGLNAGLATMVLGSSGGLRTGVTWHRFGDAGGVVWLWEVGFVTRP